MPVAEHFHHFIDLGCLTGHQERAQAIAVDDFRATGIHPSPPDCRPSLCTNTLQNECYDGTRVAAHPSESPAFRESRWRRPDSDSRVSPSRCLYQESQSFLDSGTERRASSTSSRVIADRSPPRAYESFFTESLKTTRHSFKSCMGSSGLASYSMLM